MFEKVKRCIERDMSIIEGEIEIWVGIEGVFLVISEQGGYVCERRSVGWEQ